jgi:hypothetical protein
VVRGGAVVVLAIFQRSDKVIAFEPGFDKGVHSLLVNRPTRRRGWVRKSSFRRRGVVRLRVFVGEAFFLRFEIAIQQ